MSENTDPHPLPGNPGSTARHRLPDQFVPHGNPTTQQIRIIGRRRAEAEEKLARHLEEVQHRVKEESPSGDASADRD